MKANFTENYYNEDYFTIRAGFLWAPIYSIYFWKLKFLSIMTKLHGYPYSWGVFLRWIIFSIGVPKNILDAGCGTGDWVGYCNRHGVAAEGFDFSTFAISYPINYTVRDKIKLGNVTDIPFPDNYAELVTCLDVMEHIYEEENEKAINELERVAQKYVFLNIACANHEREIYSFERGQEVPSRLEGLAVAGHVNVRPREYWLEKFEKKGWKFQQDMYESFSNTVTPKIPNWFKNYIYIYRVDHLK